MNISKNQATVLVIALLFAFCLIFSINVSAEPKKSVVKQTAESSEDALDESAEDNEEEDDSVESKEDQSKSDNQFEEEEDLKDELSDLKDLETSEVKESPFSFGGFIKEDIGYSYAADDPDYSKIRTILNLSFGLKISKDWRMKGNWNGFYDYAYTHLGRDDISDDILEEQETESEIRDFYIDGNIANWMQFKFGRQIIAWGESEYSQITDMINPRDMRELGMADIEDARIPVFASKLTFAFDAWGFDLVAMHEVRANKLPGAGSEFDMLKDLRSVFTIKDEEIPDGTGENTEYAVRLFKSFNGGDIRIMWADVFDDAIHLDFHQFIFNGLAYDLTLIPRHKRITAYGMSANFVSDSWLFNGEVAKKIGKAVARNDVETQIGVVALLGPNTYTEDTKIIKPWTEKDITQMMLGAEYSGISDLRIRLEVSGEQIEEYEDNLMDNETSAQLSTMISYSAWNGQLETQLMWIRFSDNNGDVCRLNIGYDIVDALNISGGIIAYEASDEDATVYPYRKNDRLFAALKYSF